MTKMILAGLAALAIGGCATPSDVVPYGKDTYAVAVDDAAGWDSPEKLQIRAAQEANAHCFSLGKQMEVQTSKNRGMTGWTVTSSQLVFRCV